MPIHPPTEGVAQDRPVNAAVHGAVDRPRYRRRQRNEHHLAALAPHAQNAVTVFLAQVGDVRPAHFEDP